MQLSRSTSYGGGELMKSTQSLQKLPSYTSTTSAHSNNVSIHHKPRVRPTGVQLASRISFQSETHPGGGTEWSPPPSQLTFDKTVQVDTEGCTTPESLSWRHLHMSRAKLKATATTSELLSGFAMVAMVELQINDPTNVPEWLFVTFAVCTTVLVAVHIFALMISTYILPHIDAVAKLDDGVGSAPLLLLAESPHERMRHFIEIAWAFSTVLGLFLFLVEVGILCWVKFWDYSFAAAIAATVIVIPVLILFVLFVVHFYQSLVAHRCVTSEADLIQLEAIKRTLDLQTASMQRHQQYHHRIVSLA